MKHTVAHIIPLARLRNNLDFFSYAIPHNLTLTPGMVVYIPFRSKEIVGIVLEIIEEECNFPLKEIKGIVTEKYTVQEWQLDLMRWMSTYFLVSMSHIALSIVPDIPKKIHTSSQRSLTNITTIKKDLQPLEILPNTHTLIHYSSFDQCIDVILHTLKQKKSSGMILVVVPYAEMLSEITPYLGEHFHEIVIWDPKASKNTHWDASLQLTQGNARICIGTRSAIFASVSNLDTIILVEPGNKEMTQEEPSPRYCVRDVAYFLANAHNARVIELSTTPSIQQLECVYQSKSIYTDIRVQKKYSYEIVNMNAPAAKSPLPYISNNLFDGLDSLKTAIILNKKGTFSRAVCKDCGTVMSLDTTETQPKVVCSQCFGVNYYFSGIGIHELHTLIKQHFPHRRCTLVDASQNLTSEELQEITSHADILIGTDLMAHSTALKSFDVVAFLSVDVELFSSEYTATEKALAYIQVTTSYTNLSCKRIIQTYAHEHPVFSYLASRTLKNYYLQERSLRKTFNYPPFTHVYELTYKHRSEKDGAKEVKKLYEGMPLRDTISPPQLAHVARKRTWYQWHMYIKSDDPSTLKELRALPLQIEKK
jgi:primosomal protein N' (replication factor Y)